MSAAASKSSSAETSSNQPLEPTVSKPSSADTQATPVTPKQITSTNVISRKLRDAFKAFDQQSVGFIAIDKLGPLLNSLSIYPTKFQLSTIISGMVDLSGADADPEQRIYFAKFEEVASILMLTSAMRQADEDHLLLAFKTIDIENKG